MFAEIIMAVIVIVIIFLNKVVTRVSGRDDHQSQSMQSQSMQMHREPIIAPRGSDDSAPTDSGALSALASPVAVPSELVEKPQDPVSQAATPLVAVVHSLPLEPSTSSGEARTTTRSVNISTMRSAQISDKTRERLRAKKPRVMFADRVNVRAFNVNNGELVQQYTRVT
jgi:hypothetical protein